MTDSEDSGPTTVVRVVSEGDKCPECGRSMYGDLEAVTKSKSGNLVCRHCSAIFKENGSAVPIAELEQLADSFENRAKTNQDKAIPTEGHKGIAVGRKRSAKELRELIADYTDE